MCSIGIMQGRLTKSNGRGIQFFPFDNWREEFFSCKSLKIDEIEWIFDFENFEENPLWTLDGCEEIKKCITETNVVVNSVCWDYFMRRAFFKHRDSFNFLLDENKTIFKRILHNANIIGASLIEVPMVDDSSLKNQNEQCVIDFVHWMCEEAKKYGIDISLETDFPPETFSTFLDEFSLDNLFANYDSGNSSGLGYDCESEIISLNKYVRNVHIKDRIYQKGTVKLGTGDAKFDVLFSCLKQIEYKKSFILQAARGIDGLEYETIKSQREFVLNYLNLYGFR